MAARDDFQQPHSRDTDAPRENGAPRETGALREPAGGPADISNNGLSALTEDHDRIARDVNDTLVHQLFTVSLDLHAALSRINRNTAHDTDAHHAADKIRHAITGLDQAINNLRKAVVALNDL